MERFFVPLLVFGVFTFIGVVFLAAGVILWAGNMGKRKRCTCRTAGRVAGLAPKRRRNGGGKLLWHAVFSYQAAGEQLIQTSGCGLSRPSFRTGQPVTVFYNPGRPREYYVEEEKTAVHLAGLFVGLGTGLCLMGLLLFFLILYFTHKPA